LITEFRINEGRGGNQQLQELGATVSIDEAGNFVVLWHELPNFELEPDAGEPIFTRVFDAEGNPISGDVHIGDNFLSIGGEAAVAMLGLGRYVVVRVVQTPGPAGKKVVARIVESSGEFVTDEFDVSQGGEEYGDTEANVTSSGNGIFWVTWSRLTGSGASWEDSKAMVHRFSADGAPLGEATVASAPAEGIPTYTSSVSRYDGRMLVAWRWAPALPGMSYVDRRILGQFFLADGEKAGMEFQVNEFKPGLQYPDIPRGGTFLSDGTAVVVWEAHGDDKKVYPCLYTRRHDITGKPIGGQVKLDSPG